SVPSSAVNETVHRNAENDIQDVVPTLRTPFNVQMAQLLYPELTLPKSFDHRPTRAVNNLSARQPASARTSDEHSNFLRYHPRMQRPHANAAIPSARPSSNPRR